MNHVPDTYLTLTTGIYYPVGSLKSELCIRGRDLLYKRCEALGIPFKKTQKVS
jgi:L-2-hydroxyglutarate oxidase LhgO